MSVQQLETLLIREAFGQSYENRTVLQHQVTTKVMAKVFPSLGCQKIRLLASFCTMVAQQLGDLKESAKLPCTIIQRSQTGEFKSQQVVSRQDLMKFDFSKLTLYLSCQSIKKCQQMNSIEEQVKMLQRCEYFQELSRKKMYFILRNASMLTYSFGQDVYKEGNQFSEAEASIYLVREGKFCFKKNTKDQHSNELYQFGAGDIFGLEENEGDMLRKRQFTVSCRSSLGCIFAFNHDFYSSFLKRHVEQLIKEKYAKINLFLNQSLKKVESNRTKNSSLLRQPISLRASLSDAHTFLTIPNSKRIGNDRLAVSLSKNKQKNSLPPLKNVKEGLSKKQSQPSLVAIVDPQYQEQANIMNKKNKCDILRKYYQSKHVQSRGSVLLSLMKNSWQFQKNKHKNILI